MNPRRFRGLFTLRTTGRLIKYQETGALSVNPRQKRILMDNSRGERDLAINEFIKTNDTRAIYLKLIPKLYRELFYRIYTGNNSRADAVKAKCLECKSMSRREIKECSNSLCPLFDFKPYK